MTYRCRLINSALSKSAKVIELILEMNIRIKTDKKFIDACNKASEPVKAVPTAVIPIVIAASKLFFDVTVDKKIRQVEALKNLHKKHILGNLFFHRRTLIIAVV